MGNANNWFLFGARNKTFIELDAHNLLLILPRKSFRRKRMRLETNKRARNLFDKMILNRDTTFVIPPIWIYKPI